MNRSSPLTSAGKLTHLIVLCSKTMANSRYEYVKQFERENFLLPDTYIIVRVDGKGFHKFSDYYNFAKPNDIGALEVMNEAALHVFKQISDIVMAYGDSDEYSFLLRKKCSLYERREMKIVTLFAATMAAAYQHIWNTKFPDKPLQLERLPIFDARAVVYPSMEHVSDYFRWRQVDCHINNLYNTTFWALVLKGGMSPKEAENRLIGTVSSDKNEILFKEFGINYNNEPEIFKKGTVIVREYQESVDESLLSQRQKQRYEKKRGKASIMVHHIDLIKNDFWDTRPWLQN